MQMLQVMQAKEIESTSEYALFFILVLCAVSYIHNFNKSYFHMVLF